MIKDDLKQKVKTELFNYELPHELIAQRPLLERSDSRLMILDRGTKQIHDAKFRDILSYLNPGDLLVLNNSKVRHARLHGIKENTGAKVEILLLRHLDKDRWEALVKPGKRVKAGTQIEIDGGVLRACVVKSLEFEAGTYEVRLSAKDNDNNRESILVDSNSEHAELERLIRQSGSIPLPPYITERLNDNDRYQTVYADALGSAAAPTAGLHFTDEILKRLEERGIVIAYVTLHVGLGTFRPVKTEYIDDHFMHSEFYEVQKETAKQIQAAKSRKSRVIAVGSTVARTLESLSEIKASTGWTDIFISPGYQFKLVDAMLTNFHLPKSTLLMMVSAFSSREHLLEAYRRAVESRYRFFSFGDAMLII